MEPKSMIFHTAKVPHVDSKKPYSPSLLSVTIGYFQSHKPPLTLLFVQRDCRKGICFKCTSNLVFDGAVLLFHSLAKAGPGAVKNETNKHRKTSPHEEHIEKRPDLQI